MSKYLFTIELHVILDEINELSQSGHAAGHVECKVNVDLCRFMLSMLIIQKLGRVPDEIGAFRKRERSVSPDDRRQDRR